MIHNRLLIGLALIGSLALGLQAEYIRDDNKKIVLDSSNGLMWQDDAIGISMNWATALTTCENLTLGAYSDWRLPNNNELYNLADKSRIGPKMSPVFTQVVSDSYWSSTTEASGSSNYAWIVYFSEGLAYLGNKTNSSYVRCVRGGL